MIRRLLQKNLLTLLIPLAIISLAIQPLLTGHMPWQGDGLLHYVRLAVLQNDVARGDWFPRWSPDLAYGYGFPLFNFYAPFSYYVGLPFRWLGFSLKAATNMSYILAMWVMATGAYLWGKDAWNKTAGAVAAVLLCYNPYILNNLLHRSALAELWGLAWLMATLWGIQRLFDVRPIQRGGRLTTFLITTLCYTALMLSHNITAMIGTPFIVGYAVYNCFTTNPLMETEGEDTTKKPIFLLFIPLALALSAFFWLPAFVEKDLVQVERLVDGANFAYTNHFLSLTQDIAVSFSAGDSSWLNSIGTPSFTLFTVSLPFIFLFTILFRFSILRISWSELFTDQNRALLHLLLYLFALLLPIFLAIGVSEWLWDLLPLLHFVQFPWRFLGLTAISTTLLTIILAQYIYTSLVGVALHDARSAAIVIIPLVIGINLLARNPNLWPVAPQNLPFTDSQTTADITEFEVSTGWLGTTAAGDYLPRTVESLPLPIDIPYYTTDQTNLNLDEAQLISFNQFYFPTWNATQNDQPLILEPSSPHGFLQAEIPAGNHTIEFEQANSQIQSLGNQASLIGLLFVAIVLVMIYYSDQTATSPTDQIAILKQQEQRFSLRKLPWPTLIPTLIPFLLFLSKTAVLDHINSVFHQPYSIRSESSFRPLELNFENQIKLVGYQNMATGTPQRGSDLDASSIRLFWEPIAPSIELSVGLHLFDEQGYQYGQSDSFHPGKVPVTNWIPNTYISDDHELDLLIGTPIRPYLMDIFVYDPSTGRRLEILNLDGLPIGNHFQIPNVFVSGIATASTIRSQIDYKLPIPRCTLRDVCFIGHNRVSGNEFKVGEQIPLTLFFDAVGEGSKMLRSEFTLTHVNSNKSFAYGIWTEAVTQTFESSTDYIYRMEYSVFIPPTFGDRTPIETGLYELSYGGIPIHSFTVLAPERVFNYEPLSLDVGKSLDDKIFLDSIQLSQKLTELDPTQPLTTSFLWRPQESTDQSYKVFVQLLNSEQRIVAQSDKIPVNGDTPRPSTSWVPDEYLLDTHQLFLPADLDPTAEYTLIVGLYNEATGERLTVTDSDTDLTYIPIQP